MEPPPKGPRALAARIKEVYKDLFEASHEPQKSPSELSTFFKIHGGASERTTDYQIQTFKALSEYADFSGATDPSGREEDVGGGSNGGGRLPSVKIDLHIHLPENKTARDYESIIQDIAKYIYGRSVADRA
jgi:hypothetical protein